jgi:hypothetical protein
MLQLFNYNKSNTKNKNKLECPVCFEDKSLYLFCDEHKFCSKCIKDWLQKNSFCPLCRKICTNKRYFKYNIVNSNHDFDNIDIVNFDYYFDLWHKPTCINRHHKFFISRTGRNSYIFYCVDCHIEQKIKKIIYENTI